MRLQTTPAKEFLSSWNEGSAKQHIMDFVTSVTADPKSPTYVSPKKRIAVFDNDGTLCAEHPNLIMDGFLRILAKQMIQKDSAFAENEACKIIADRKSNYKQILTIDQIREVHLAGQSGMTEKEFKNKVKEYFKIEKSTYFNKKYTELVYQPMVELIEYLKANNFRVYLNTAASTEIARVFAKKAYKIQPNKVIGTAFEIKYEETERQINLMRLNRYALPINNGSQKPVNLQRFIGRAPLLAVGNSDGDLEMLSYAKAQKFGLAILLKHDDGAREFIYNKNAEEVLKKAETNDWLVVSMKNDFKTIFA